MAISPYLKWLRRYVGHDLLWIPQVTDASAVTAT
jgi:hypothetical protein